MHDLSATVRYEVREGVARISFDNPTKLNALDLDGWRAIAEGLRRAAQETTAPVVLTGVGRAFCAGDDIAALPALMSDRVLAEAFGEATASPYPAEILRDATSYAQELVRGVLANRTAIDGLIQLRAPLWPWRT